MQNTTSGKRSSLLAIFIMPLAFFPSASSGHLSEVHELRFDQKGMEQMSTGEETVAFRTLDPDRRERDFISVSGTGVRRFADQIGASGSMGGWQPRSADSLCYYQSSR